MNLRRDGRSKTINVNVLVLTAFVGPKPPGHVSRHLDGTRDNNVLGNLAWGTPSENAADADRHGLVPRGERHWSRTKPERIPTGERHWRARDPDSVRRKAAVFELAARGIGYIEIAMRLGMHSASTHRMLHGRARKRAVA